MVINSSQDRTNAIDIFLQIGNLQNKEPFAVVVILEREHIPIRRKTNGVIVINVSPLKLNIKLLFGGPAIDILNFYCGKTRA